MGRNIVSKYLIYILLVKAYLKALHPLLRIIKKGWSTIKCDMILVEWLNSLFWLFFDNSRR